MQTTIQLLSPMKKVMAQEEKTFAPYPKASALRGEETAFQAIVTGEGERFAHRAVRTGSQPAESAPVDEPLSPCRFEHDEELLHAVTAEDLVQDAGHRRRLVGRPERTRLPVLHARAPGRVVRTLPVAEPDVRTHVVRQDPQAQVPRRRDARDATAVRGGETDGGADSGCRVDAPSRTRERPGIHLSSHLRTADSAPTQRRRGEDAGSGRTHADHGDVCAPAAGVENPRMWMDPRFSAPVDKPGLQGRGSDTPGRRPRSRRVAHDPLQLRRWRRQQQRPAGRHPKRPET